MIDYSVYMMAPSLDEEGAPKAYARAQMRELVTFDKFVRHIAEHNGAFSTARRCSWARWATSSSR